MAAQRRRTRRTREDEPSEGGDDDGPVWPAGGTASPPPAAASAPTEATTYASSMSCPLRVALVSDFFYPRLGGVELHQFSLAQALRRRGHHVVVITGTYEREGKADEDDEAEEGEPKRRQGVRFIADGLKVYYLPVLSLHQQASLPNLFCAFPLLRSILLRERIDLVHGHQSTSGLAHESLLHARTMGLACVFTDHSLFGFASPAAIHLNKAMKFSLTNATAVICVSHCSKENLVLRAYLDPSKVAVIPNAVDTTKLRPNPNNASPIEQRLTIVVLSRLVYRKGVDLLLEVIPRVCMAHPSVHFLIGGDGPKRVAMEEMREKHRLQERVEMIGAVAHCDVLTRGHVYLNCSLTESFCIALLEAVSCGLYSVSTRVGGVPEILPADVLAFAEPNADDLVRAVSLAVHRVADLRRHQPDYPHRAHRMVRDMYNWHAVAERTERVYRRAVREHWTQMASEQTDDAEAAARLDSSASITAAAASSSTPLIARDPGSLFSLSLPRVRSFRSCGVFVGLLFALVVVLDHLLWRFLEWAQPRDQIDPAVNFPRRPTPKTTEHAAEEEQRHRSTEHSLEASI